MSPKASSLAAIEAEKPELDEEMAFSPKLEVLVRSPNGLIKCPVSSETQDDAISIRGRITISF